MRFVVLATMVACLFAPASAMAQAQVRKPVVSVDDIKDLANTGQAAVLRQMIETTVVNTGKFRIMERGAQGEGVLVREQQGAKAGLYTSNTPGKIGGFEGVDFKVYGTITTAQSASQRDASASAAAGLKNEMLRQFGGRMGVPTGNFQGSTNCNSAAASLAVDIRITDASTGELRYAKTITQTQQGATTCGGRTEIDYNSLMRSAAQNVSMGLVTTMFPVKVIDVSNGEIIFNYGEGLLGQGDVFAVFQQGRAIIDPDTGAELGRTESLLGLARVTEVLPKMSKAVMVTPFPVQPAVGAVARGATPEQLQALAPPANAGRRR